MKSVRSNIRSLALFFALLSVVSGHNALADTVSPPPDNKGVKVAVEEFFAETPQMILIAQCESRFQQYTSKGTALTGAGGRYVGVFQIAKSHAPNAKKLGFDIYTLDGNLGFAKHLYEQQGVRPWKGCIKTTPTVAEKKSHPLLTKNLGIGTKDPEVKTLQKILNAAGFFVARTGAGSPNHETDTFNSKTRDALKRFQCKKNIACEGSENSTGYGHMGPSTRGALLAEAKKQEL